MSGEIDFRYQTVTAQAHIDNVVNYGSFANVFYHFLNMSSTVTGSGVVEYSMVSKNISNLLGQDVLITFQESLYQNKVVNKSIFYVDLLNS